MSNISLSKRIRVFERDLYTCQYCGSSPDPSALELDHVMPRARKGTHDDENLKTCCKSCNLAKGGRNLNGFRFHMSVKQSIYFGIVPTHYIYKLNMMGICFPDLKPYVFFFEKKEPK